MYDIECETWAPLWFGERDHDRRRTNQVDAGSRTYLERQPCHVVSL